nr:uncharacterized protein LOC111505607 [Leptinotarsa decemlineata]
MPENLTEVTAIVNILVEKNGSIIGSRPIKCESKLRELEQILRSTANPVEFMCQALGFSPAERELLDNWLVHRLQNNIPPHFNLISRSESIESADVPGRKHKQQRYSRRVSPTELALSGNEYGSSLGDAKWVGESCIEKSVEVLVCGSRVCFEVIL